MYFLYQCNAYYRLRINYRNEIDSAQDRRNLESN
ncbi:MAG: hypothetical protein QOI07_1282 [Verrucomicrobiota bacterium]|jgi:hypothetical protein